METSSTDNRTTYNVLLLGETGVGKSTFINAFLNYSTYNTLTEAEQKDPLFLVATSFTVHDDEFQPRKIQVGSSTNEAEEVGASATQNPVNYIFDLGDIYIRLIDTPGIGDTRGANQDNINFDKLLMHIAELKELHAICILLKPNEARITVMFEYCIKQLLSRLEKSASKNIIFLLTNTKGTNYRPGETLPALRKLLETTEERPPFVKIPLLKENIFCIDNEGFSFLFMVQNGIQYHEADKRGSAASWEQSSNECLRMISYIKQLPPHKVQNTISVNEARRLIIQLSQPLAEVAELIQQNIIMLQFKKDELKYHSHDIKKLKEILYIPVVNLNIEPLTTPRTVCTSSKCCEVLEEPKENGEQKYHHEKSCCDPCYLKYIPTAMIGAEELIFCQAMLSKNGNTGEIIVNGVKNLFKSYTKRTDDIECTVCGCNYKYHKHIYYRSSLERYRIVDSSIELQLKNKKNTKAAVELLIQNIEKRSSAFQKEHDFINISSAKFAHFLKSNAITPFNDAYENFLDHSIDKEESFGKHADKQRIQMFKNMLICYQQEKTILEKALKDAQLSNTSETSFISPADIMETVTELYQLENFGTKIKEMVDKQVKARSNENTREREVKVKSSTFGFFQRMANSLSFSSAMVVSPPSNT